MLAALTACTTIPQGKLPAKSIVVKATSSQPVAQSAEVVQLLRAAKIAFMDDRLTTPVDDNAWYRYLRVLVLDEKTHKRCKESAT